MIEIRTATTSDAPAMLDIYAPIVRETAISFESEPPSTAEMQSRITSTLQTHPWLVAVENGTLLGYAYGSQFRARAAYRWTSEVSAYVSQSARGSGVGRLLYGQLLAILTRQNFHSALAIITLPNAASVGFHQSFGFESVGVLPEVGFKFSTWHDVETLRLSLSDAVQNPAEPIPFPAL